jgi:Cytochrome c oxidase caa3 assembly factor (Caa3_CtaG)
VDRELTGHQTAVPCPRSSRPWLAAAGIVLVVACLVPSVGVLARRYLFVESIQFCAFALAAPALVALSATLRLGASGPGGLLPRGVARFDPDPAGARQRRASFVAMLSYLIAWVVLCVFWRLPWILDELARHPVLVLPEVLTMGAAGLGLWLGLVPAPSAPRSPRPERALVAALAMWSVWVIAYILGFAHDSVVHAYDLAGSHLSTMDDQEITAFLLWAAAGVAFAPVVYTVLFNWLKDSSEPAAGPAGRVPGSGVRGWRRR